MLLWHTDYCELKAFCPFYFWKQGIELPCERCPPWTRRKEDNLITRQGESRPREICTNLVKLTLIFLSTSPQYTIPKPKPLCLINSSQIVSLSKKCKSFLLWACLQFFILSWRLLYAYENSIKLLCFSHCKFVLCQFNSQAQPENKSERGKCFLHYKFK